MPSFPFLRAKVPTLFDIAVEQRKVTEAVLRSASNLVAADSDLQTTMSRHCETLTAMAPHIVLAWTWFGPVAAQAIRPQVVAGSAAAYARALCIERNPLTERGPAFRTLAGKRLQPFNISARSLFGPWRDAAKAHAVRSVLAIPLSSTHSDQAGLFVLYADVPGFFDAVGVGVFDALGHLFGAVLSRSARNAELALAANCDALTGLMNRRGLAMLDAELMRVTDHDEPVSLVMVDIDHFKRVNDQHGHSTGDAVLRGVARTVQTAVRHVDSVARWGGEEFVVCLPGADLEGAVAVAEKLRRAVAAAHFGLGTDQDLGVTVSMGVAQLRIGETLSQGIVRADHALYAAKESGRDRVMVAPLPDTSVQV